MQQALLIINSGSSSLKFSVFEIESGMLNPTAIARGQFAPIDLTTQFKVTVQKGNPIEKILQLPKQEHNKIPASLFRFLLAWFENQFPTYSLMGAGHRVIHGGNTLIEPVLMHAEILQKLQTLCPLAPTHQPYNLAGIEILAKELPAVKQVACFDTAFHATNPELARAYALPDSVTKNLIKRYGFHGLSYEYIAQVLPDYLESKRADDPLIVAHLGHGASLCAMQNRKSIATTMGFTGLEGLPMGTRCGHLDPGVILYLLSEEKMTVSEIRDLLYNKSGLLGISEISDDVRELVNSRSPKAKFAIDLFVYHVVKEIGALAATLGGLNALVFTGGIGENAAVIREKVCQQLDWLGIRLNLLANQENQTKISANQHSIPVLVIPTNEELVIAQHTWRCIKK